MPTQITHIHLALLLSLGACTSSTPFIAKEYVWVQKQDGLGMKAPIMFRVRVSWAKDTLNWAENVTDAAGKQDLRTHNYYTSGVPGLAAQRCEYWDDDNWSCVTTDARSAPIMSQTMKDGKLNWYYWGEMREMTTRYRVWNKPTPF